MSWWWMSPWSGATGCRHARLFLMEAAVQLQTAAEDARSLLAAARTDWGRPVPQCPGWDAAGLVRHMGGILVWMAAVVTSGERVSRRTLDPGPADPADLPRWYLASLDRTLDVLGSAGPGSGTWTFSSIGDRRVAWWNRRLAVEVAIHRWDAQDAVAKFPQAPEVREINSEVIVVQSLIKAISATPAPAAADLQKDEDELARQERTLRQLIEKATQRRPTV